MMNLKLRLFLAIFGVMISPLLAEPLSKPKPLNEVRFGEKSDKTITVVVGGDVAHPGKYFLPKGFGLKSVLGITGGYGWTGHRSHDSAKTAQFRGRIQIFRAVDGAESAHFEYKIADLYLAESADVVLLDGDVVNFVALRFYEE